MTSDEIDYVCESLRGISRVIVFEGQKVTAHLGDGNQATFFGIEGMFKWMEDALNKKVSSDKVVNGVYDDIMRELAEESEHDEVVNETA